MAAILLRPQWYMFKWLWIHLKIFANYSGIILWWCQCQMLLSRAFTHPNPHIAVWTDVLVFNVILFSLHLKLLCGSDYLSALNAGSTNICYKFPNNSKAKCKNVQRFELLHSAYTFWYHNFISLRPCCAYILKVTSISLNPMYHIVQYFDRLPRASLHAGIILGMGSANERQRYDLTSSPIGWDHTQTGNGLHKVSYVFIQIKFINIFSLYICILGYPDFSL